MGVDMGGSGIGQQGNLRAPQMGCQRTAGTLSDGGQGGGALLQQGDAGVGQAVLVLAWVALARVQQVERA